MQTGQNSIASENSLPQIGQMRWGSVFMDLTALWPQSEPKATPRSTEWGEIGQQRRLVNGRLSLSTVVCPIICAASSK